MPRDPFDGLIREIKDLERSHTVSVPIQADEKGYYDKECPSKSCLFVFKVQGDDWASLFQDEAVFCPRCGHSAPADHWWTSEQLSHAKKVAVRQFHSRLDRALRRGADAFNRASPRGGFIQMSMRVTGSRPSSFLIPSRARELLEQDLQCLQCHARYAVLGSAFFCPCCGNNSVEQDFDNGQVKTLQRLDNLPVIREALVSQGLPDQAEDTCRIILEASIEDSVTAFQSLCDHLYRRIPQVQPPQRNVFQRLDDGSALWGSAIGIGYGDVLTDTELAQLRRLFQTRHLLAHTSGIVDQNYIDRSADSTYSVGQRVVVTVSDARALLQITRKLADGIRARCP